MSPATPEAQVANPAGPADALPLEEQARGDFYALLARLYASPPDTPLLAAIAGAPPLGAGERELARAWERLRQASSAVDRDAAEEEYVTLFVGTGRSEVSLYGSSYVDRGTLFLAEVRAALAGLGLAARAGGVYEDHFATVLETMRVLVLGAPDLAPVDLATQQRFFASFVLPWAESCCAAIKQNCVANYYARVAELTQIFVAIERDAFAMEGL